MVMQTAHAKLMWGDTWGNHEYQGESDRKTNNDAEPGDSCIMGNMASKSSYMHSSSHTDEKKKREAP